MLGSYYFLFSQNFDIQYLELLDYCVLFDQYMDALRYGFEIMNQPHLTSE